MKPKDSYSIGVDLGGTKILAAVLDPKFRILSEHKAPSEPNRGEKFFIGNIKSCIQTAIRKSKVSVKKLRVIGVGCPGMIDFSRGMVKLSPNIKFLKKYPLRDVVSRILKLPVIIENDVNAGLYGEWKFGAAKGYRDAAGIFLGTGVGGAFILDGRLYRGATGAAGEIGHTFLGAPSLLDSYDKASTVEGLLGRLKIASEAGLLILKQKAPELFKEVEYDIRKIKSKALLHSMTQGDEAIHHLLLQKAKILGLAMANLVNLLNPEIIVLGGGIIEAMEHCLLPEAREVMKKYAMGPIVKSVKVSAAKLGDDAIVMGAARLAIDEIESKGGE